MQVVRFIQQVLYTQSSQPESLVPGILTKTPGFSQTIPLTDEMEPG